MKRICTLVASVMLLCLSAYALKGGAFRSLEHISSCENLLVIQVPQSYQGNPPSYETDEPTLAYDVEIMKDLRSEHSAGAKVTVSVRRKFTAGSRYLLAGKPATRGGIPWLLFQWELGVVEIPSTFNLSTLEGKDIPTQVTALLSARRDEIERQLNELSQEKESVDRIIPEEAPNKPDAGDGEQPPRRAQPEIDIVTAGGTAMQIVKTTRDPEAKWMAVRILGSLRYEPAVPLLLESLSDAHHYVRANAARALGDMKVAAAAKPLTELLEKEADGGVIQQTSLALANLGCSDALPALKGAAKHEDVQTRMWVLQAVGRLGEKWDVPFLALFLDDPSQPVQESAAMAIEQITGADFGFPKRSGLYSPGEPLKRARQWWEEHKGEFRNR